MTRSPLVWGFIGLILLGTLTSAMFDDDASGRTRSARMAEMPEMSVLGSQKIGSVAYYFYDFTVDGEYCIVVRPSIDHGVGLSCRETQ